MQHVDMYNACQTIWYLHRDRGIKGVSQISRDLHLSAAKRTHCNACRHQISSLVSSHNVNA